MKQSRNVDQKFQKIKAKLKKIRKIQKSINKDTTQLNHTMHQTNTKTEKLSTYLLNEKCRDYDGSANNLNHPDWGASNTPLLRKAPSAYNDNVSTFPLRGPNNPSPREVSNAICKQTSSHPNTLNLTDMTWVWGQFIDHTIDLTKSGSNEPANILTSGSDPNEDFPNRTILFSRSEFIPNTSPREQPNHIASYLDGTNVYGYDSQRALALRRLDGTGKLKTSSANNNESLLPLNVDNLSNANHPNVAPTDAFLAGDIRANENIMLSALHTLFVREHNRICKRIMANHPYWIGQDELIYQRARRFVIAKMQAITFNEYLPALLGSNSIPPYPGYQNTVNSGIVTEFSTVTYRLGHSMLSSSLQVNNSGSTVLLRNAFFNPDYLKQNGINDLIIGMCSKLMEEINSKIVDDIRNFLFGPPTAQNLLDLASLNIQRGRDHGIPGYNAVRQACSLSTKATFASVTSNSTLATALENLYDHPDHMDPWVGALAEDHLTGKAMGELLFTSLLDQFVRLRNGDRYWFQNDPSLTSDQKKRLNKVKLSDIIRSNTNWTHIRDDVFHL